MKAEDGKMKAIVDMPQPTDVSGVRRFCGMMQYMAKFITSLSTTLEPLRKITQKDTYLRWTEDCEKAFTDIKKQLTCTPILAYYNPDLELTVQTKRAVKMVLELFCNKVENKLNMLFAFFISTKIASN